MVVVVVVTMVVVVLFKCSTTCACRWDEAVDYWREHLEKQEVGLTLQYAHSSLCYAHPLHHAQTMYGLLHPSTATTWLAIGRGLIKTER